MRHLTTADYRVMPWKDGGGTTMELHAEPGPPRDGLPWLWRVSIATIERDGPFSRFPGCDRHIMGISGDGVVLEGAPAGPISLRQLFVPQSFSGEDAVSAHLIEGTVKDFNLIARRADLASELTAGLASGPLTLAASPSTCLLCNLGPASADTDTAPAVHQSGAILLAKLDCIILAPGETATLDTAHPGPWRYALCRLTIADH